MCLNPTEAEIIIIIIIKRKSCFAAAGNILILEDKDPKTTDRLMLIDFQYSSYNYR